MNIFWFRRDLRLEDNAGLYHALQSDEEVLPIFIFDQNILSQLPKNDARVTFIHDQLSKIQSQLQKIGKSLAVFYGDPFEVYNRILSENDIKTVFTNYTYSLSQALTESLKDRVVTQTGLSLVRTTAVS